MYIGCIENCHQIAHKHNGQCLSTTYVNDRTLYQWRCSKGHIWWQTYKNIKHGGRDHKGAWCPECGGSNPLNIDMCYKLAEFNDGQCLSDTYVNAKTKYEWLCGKCDYVWANTYDHIQSGEWCPKCGGKVLKTFAELQTIVDSNHGKMLSLPSALKDSRSRLKVECQEKHIWNIPYKSLTTGCWCPECSDGKTQRLLAHIVEAILDQSATPNFREFDWLRDQRNLEIDLWFPALKLAIEYDGQQHFYPVCFGGVSLQKATRNFKKVKQLDRIKDRKIKEHPDDVKYFIRFSYMEDITEENVRLKLQQAGVIQEENNG